MINKTFYGLYKAETPLNHLADERMETTSICRYNTVLLADGSTTKVYNISAASFRNDIRQNACRRLLALTELTLDEIPEISNVILMSGGPRLERSERVEPLLYISQIRKYFPLIDLLGSTTPFCMIESNLAPTSLNALTKSISQFAVERAVLETHDLDSQYLPEVVTEFQFNTKRDPRVKFDNIITTGDRIVAVERGQDENASECGIVANMFEVQMIRKGTRLAHQVFIRDHASQMLASCFASALAEWQRNGSFVGGKISQGCGMVSWQYLPALPSPAIYEDFILSEKERIRSMIMDREIWKDQKAITKHVE